MIECWLFGSQTPLFRSGVKVCSGVQPYAVCLSHDTSTLFVLEQQRILRCRLPPTLFDDSSIRSAGSGESGTGSGGGDAKEKFDPPLQFEVFAGTPPGYSSQSLLSVPAIESAPRLDLCFERSLRDICLDPKRVGGLYVTTTNHVWYYDPRSDFVSVVIRCGSDGRMIHSLSGAAISTDGREMVFVDLLSTIWHAVLVNDISNDTRPQPPVGVVELGIEYKLGLKIRESLQAPRSFRRCKYDITRQTDEPAHVFITAGKPTACLNVYQPSIKQIVSRIKLSLEVEVNGIEQTRNGVLLLSTLDTHSIYAVNPRTGEMRQIAGLVFRPKKVVPPPTTFRAMSSAVPLVYGMCLTGPNDRGLILPEVGGSQFAPRFRYLSLPILSLEGANGHVTSCEDK